MAIMYFVALKSSKLEKIQILKKVLYEVLRKNLVQMGRYGPKRFHLKFYTTEFRLQTQKALKSTFRVDHGFGNELSVKKKSTLERACTFLSGSKVSRIKRVKMQHYIIFSPILRTTYFAHL